MCQHNLPCSIVYAHCLLPGRAFASLYVVLFLEKEAEIGGREEEIFWFDDGLEESVPRDYWQASFSKTLIIWPDYFIHSHTPAWFFLKACVGTYFVER